MTNLIILHGSKLNKNGTLSACMLKRIDTLYKLLTHLTGKKATLVISGGKTRKGYESEAKSIYNFIYTRLKEYKQLKVILEEASKTTIENIVNTKECLETENPQSTYVITNYEALKRVKYLYKLVWPEIYSSLTLVNDNYETTLLYRITELFCYTYAHIDPFNKMLKFPIKLFRNG